MNKSWIRCGCDGDGDGGDDEGRDGLSASTTQAAGRLGKGDGYEQEFTGLDTWAANASTAAASDGADQQQMVLNPAKCQKSCSASGGCSWTAHWRRPAETGDSKDHQFVEGAVKQMYLSGSYSVTAPDGTVTYKGSADPFKVAAGDTLDKGASETGAFYSILNASVIATLALYIAF